MEMGIPADQITAQAQRILRSKGFASAKKLGRLLAYTVEETIQGRADQIKEYVLGRDVFGRPPDFDPRLDPIVRVQAAKLRTRLREYYEGEGAGDPVRIEYPKGGYAPVFSRAAQEPAAVPPAETPSTPARMRRWPRWLPAAALLLAVAAGAFWLHRGRAARRAVGRAPSIAVLPFVNFSGNNSDDYLSDGLTDELIGMLSRMDGVRVVARTSVFQFKGKHQDVRKIGAQLGATMVLEGSVRRDRGRLRVTAQLSDVADGYNLWSASYERDSRDIFAIQDEISRSIAGALRLRLSARGQRTGSLEAYNAYLQGRHFWRTRAAAGLAKAREYFESALKADAAYAAAWAGLADTYSQLAIYDWEPLNEAGAKALAAARKAVELDETLGEAQTALGFALAAFEGDWKGSEAAFRRAIMLSPGDATPHRWYASQTLTFFGRLDEALREAELAVSLDPVSPLVYHDLGRVHIYRHEYEKAAAQFRKALELDPTLSRSHAELGFAYERLGRLDEARSQFLRAVELSGGRTAHLADLARFHALNGDRRQSVELLRQIGGKTGPYQLAMVYAALDRKDEAFRELQHGAATRRLPNVVLERYASLRNDPRYAAFLKRLGLPG